jgi:hypothetical protein
MVLPFGKVPIECINGPIFIETFQTFALKRILAGYYAPGKQGIYFDDGVGRFLEGFCTKSCDSETLADEFYGFAVGSNV